MRLTALVCIALCIAAPVHASAAATLSDSMPADASEVCGITTDDVVLLFIGDGAAATCRAKAHPVDIGPGGWSDVPDDSLADLVAAQAAPQCTFHLASTPPVLTRVYASAPGPDADAICTGFTQFFPSVEALPGAVAGQPPAMASPPQADATPSGPLDLSQLVVGAGVLGDGWGIVSQQADQSLFGATFQPAPAVAGYVITYQRSPQLNATVALYRFPDRAGALGSLSDPYYYWGHGNTTLVPLSDLGDDQSFRAYGVGKGPNSGITFTDGPVVVYIRAEDDNASDTGGVDAICDTLAAAEDELLQQSSSATSAAAQPPPP